MLAPSSDNLPARPGDAKLVTVIVELVANPGGRNANEGGIVTQEAPIHVSNVQLVDPETKRPARVGYKTNEDGKKVRVLRPSGKEI